MNWKRFLIEAGLIGVAATYAFAWAPVLLIAKADIFTWLAEAGIALLTWKGLKAAWKHSQKAEKKEAQMVIVPVQKMGGKKQKENQRERESLQKDHPKKRFGLRAPKFITSWRANKKQEKQNYRDAA